MLLLLYDLIEAAGVLFIIKLFVFTDEFRVTFLGKAVFSLFDQQSTMQLQGFLTYRIIDKNAILILSSLLGSA